MEGAPKCHRGHTHVNDYFDEEHNQEAAGEPNKEQDQNQLIQDHYEGISSCSCDTCEKRYYLSDSSIAENIDIG